MYYTQVVSLTIYVCFIPKKFGVRTPLPTRIAWQTGAAAGGKESLLNILLNGHKKNYLLSFYSHYENKVEVFNAVAEIYTSYK